MITVIGSLLMALAGAPTAHNFSEPIGPQAAASAAAQSPAEFEARWKDETNRKLVMGVLWTASHSDIEVKDAEALERVHQNLEAITNGERRALEPEAIRAFNERLAGLLEYDSQGIRALAAVLLGVGGDKSYASRIAVLLKPRRVTGEIPHFDRGRAAIALGLLRAKEYAPDLVKLLTSPNAFDRSGAAFGLGAMRAREHESAIAQLLNDEDEQVREAAKEALAMMRETPK